MNHILLRFGGCSEDDNEGLHRCSGLHRMCATHWHDQLYGTYQVILHGDSEAREWTNCKWFSDEGWKGSLSNQEKSFLTFLITLYVLRSATCLAC